MTNPEAAPEAVAYQIVVCGTCNVLFMAHAGRPSCPACGGLPFMVLEQGEIPADAGDQAPPTEEEPAAPAEAPAAEPPAAAADEGDPDFDEVERQAQEAKAAAVEAPASPGLQ